MERQLERLLASYRNDGMSRRELAAGLAATTAGLAVGGGAAAAQATFDPPPAAATWVPPVTGGGADDQPAIQQAIDAAAAAGGGRVLIDQPVMVASTLVMKTGVELAGDGQLVSSITAHPGFAAVSLIQVESESRNAVFRDLSLDGAGLVSRALIDLGSGCRQVKISGVRLAGWDLATPAVAGVHCDEPPDPAGSNGPIREVWIEGCEFDELGNGVKIGQGASHISVVHCRFTGMHQRCVWLLRTPELTSRFIQIVGNTMVDFPADPELANPIQLGFTGEGTQHFEHLYLGRNVIVGNDDFHGPGGLGTPDHVFLNCAVGARLVGNVSVDSGETGFSLRDSSDVLYLGNASVRSDVAGFAFVNKTGRNFGVQYIANLAWNNGLNRGGAGLSESVRSGFLLRNFGLGLHDTHFISNRAWDDQPQKTQQYALAIDHPTVYKTLLTGNLWRDSQHAIRALLNRGLSTRRAQYAILQPDP